MFAPKSTSRRASREQPLSVTASDHARQAGGIRVSQETATARPRVLAQADVLQLQRTLGNRATRHVLSSTALAGSPMLQRELDVAYLKSWATNTIETDSVWTNIVDHLAGYMMLIRLDEAVSKKVAKLEDLLKDVERWLSANQTALRTKEQRKFKLMSPKSWRPANTVEERYDQIVELQWKAKHEWQIKNAKIDRLTHGKVQNMLQAVAKQENVLSRKQLLEALKTALKERPRGEPQSKQWAEFDNQVSLLDAEIDLQMSKHPAIKDFQQSTGDIRAGAMAALQGHAATAVAEKVTGSAEDWVRTSLDKLMPADAPAYIVIALGSFARKEMALFSDTDMVLVCEEQDTAMLKGLMAAYGAMRTRINEGNQAFSHDPVIGDVFSVDAFAKAGFTDKPPDMRLIHARPSGAEKLYAQVIAKRRTPEVHGRLKNALKNLPEGPKIDLSSKEFHIKDLVLKPIITPIALLWNSDERKDPSVAEPTSVRLRAAKDARATKMADHFEFFLNLRYRLHAAAGSENDKLVKDGKLWSSEVEKALTTFGADYPQYVAYIHEQAQRL